MQLFSEAILNKLSAQKNAENSILRRMAGGPERNVLLHLNSLFDSAAPAVQDRWSESLLSTDNRRFFQGFGEAISSAFLVRSGWQVADICEPRPCVVLRHPDGRDMRVVTLAFLKTPARTADLEAKRTLARVVNRADSDHRITILVKKWEPHEFDPEPVRRCVDIWIDAMRTGQWNGRYATYEDDNIHLEFARTDQKIRNGQGAVSFLLSPSNGLHTMEVVETRLVYELDSLLKRASDDKNVLVSLVTNTAWGLPPGLLRSLFYGRPMWSVADGTAENRKFGFQLGEDTAIFQEERYATVNGILVVDQPEGRGPCARAYSNPWASNPIASSDLACACFGQERAEPDDGYRVMSWG